MMRLISNIRERQAKNDEGFSILELMMALTILMVGIVAILGTLVVATRASGLQRSRLNVVQVANEALERLRSNDYVSIAISPDDPDWSLRPTPTSASATGPTATPTDTTDPSLFVPVRPEAISMNGVVFEIRQNVNWVPFTDTATGFSYEQAFKHATVQIVWRDEVGVHDYQLESDVYPGSQGKQFTEAETLFLPNKPSNLVAILSLTSTTVADLTWDDNADNETGFELAFTVYPLGSCSNAIPPDAWVAIDPNRPPDSTTFQMSSLASSSMYCFRIRAINGAGASDWEYAADPVVTPTDPGPCVILAPYLRSPADDGNAQLNKILVDNQGWNQEKILFAVSSTGNCEYVSAVVPGKKVGSTTPYYTVPLSPAGGFWFAYEQPLWQQFSLGTSQVKFDGTGPSGNSNVVQTVTFSKK